MGAESFITSARASRVKEAFDAAQAQARYDYGHSGYTGTIAEKPGWVVIQSEPLDPETAVNLAQRLINDADPRIDDKWGPAGAVPLTTGEWLFFGWASS